jgi:predicted GIY-YIG superfamily endonuclease
MDGSYLQCYTYNRRPVSLVYFETAPFLKEASQREMQLKKWSRVKKKALIEQNLHKLRLLAQCQNLSHCLYRELRKL